MKNRDAIRVYLPKKWDPERWDKLRMTPGKCVAWADGSHLRKEDQHAEKKATGV